MRVLMIGDVVGGPGLTVLENRLPQLIREKTADFVVVNGENAADGFGMTEPDLRRILAAGATAVTSGNHIWEKRDFWPVMDSEERLLRPANYPANTGAAKTPGRGYALYRTGCAARYETGALANTPVPILVINLQGREYMNAIDCPFRCFDSIYEAECAAAGTENPIILVDFHAESAREKESLAYYLDGRASLVGGTHTHVQTADERILPNGTAYITDLGMTGITGSVIGMDPQVCLDRVSKQIMYRIVPAGGAADAPNEEKAAHRAEIQGIFAEIDFKTGKALSIQRLSST